jgi:glycosyltransferase involved in cell wall biosynthesis
MHQKVITVALCRRRLIGWGGAERELVREANYLLNKGFNIEVIVFQIDSHFKNLLEPGIRINIVSNYVKIFLFPIHVLQLRRCLKKTKPDLIIAHESMHQYLYFALLGTNISYFMFKYDTPFWMGGDEKVYSILYKNVFEKIRSRVTGHRQLMPPTYTGSLFKRIAMEITAVLDFLGTRECKGIFTLNEQVRWEIQKMYGVDAFVEGLGIETEKLNLDVDSQHLKQIRSKHAIADTSQIIITVGRLHVEKRVDMLIRAFKILTKSCPNLHLVIGGTGEEEENLKHLVQNLGLNDKVTFAGFIPDEQLSAYYLLADVVAFPLWANWSLAVLEALALNKKVVVADESMVEAYGDLPNVFEAYPNEVALADILRQALTAPTKESRSAVVRKWEWHICFERILGKMLRQLSN